MIRLTLFTNILAKMLYLLLLIWTVSDSSLKQIPVWFIVIILLELNNIFVLWEIEECLFWNQRILFHWHPFSIAFKNGKLNYELIECVVLWLCICLFVGFKGKGYCYHSYGGNLNLHWGHYILIFIQASKHLLWYMWLQGVFINFYVGSNYTSVESLGGSALRNVRQIEHSEVV